MEGAESNKQFTDFSNKTEKQIESFITGKHGAIRDLQYMALRMFKRTGGDQTKIDDAMLESVWCQGDAAPGID